MSCLLWLAVRPTPPRFELPRWMQITAKATQGVLWLLLLALMTLARSVG